MIVAVASGKGGTGKTTVALGLTTVSAPGVQLLDCDVEEPNCHLFLGGDPVAVAPVEVLVPEVDLEKCTLCGACGEVCQYSAIVVMKKEPLIFPHLCHGCGACTEACQYGALREVPREVGRREMRRTPTITLLTGRLNVGEAMAPPVIRQVRAAGTADLQIIDAPPGVSCAAVAAVHGADFVVLVTEPTPFGLHDLELMLEAVRGMGLPHGVVINKAADDRPLVMDYCAAKQISVLATIPESRILAKALSEGQLPTRALPEAGAWFVALRDRIRQEVTR